MYSNYLRGWDATQEVVWVTRDGSAEPIDPGWTGVFPGLALSPDGSHLAVHAVADNQGHILLKQLDRGPLTRLSSGGITNYRPAWTADGDTVAYVSLRGDNRHLYHVATGGGSPVQLLREGTPAINEVHFSPNGEWLVYRSGSGSTAQGRDIYGARLGSDEAPTPLVVTEFQETSPAVSPDGRWLAYVSNRGGQYDVYVRPFPNTADMRWAVSTGGGVEPVWARSGRELFYKSGGNLVAARIVADSTFVITDRQILFSIEPYGPPYEQTQRYAVAPDDQRFVMVRGGTTGPSIELVVVENFFADLKERVGN